MVSHAFSAGPWTPGRASLDRRPPIARNRSGRSLRRDRSRRPLLATGSAAAVAAVTALTTACAPALASPIDTPAAATLPPAPPMQVPPLLTQEQVDHAVASVDGLVTDAMDRTGVPGVAVAVVHQDQVV